MRSKTLFFNPTLFWKNVTRFWPLWAAYTLFWVTAFPVRGLNTLRRGEWIIDPSGYGFHKSLIQSLYGYGLMLAAVFGILCAMALFSYLYQSRSVCMIHSLPLRRECLFLTNYLSGVVFFLVPNTAAALLTLLVELMAGDVLFYVVGIWWLAINALCLFFYSFAVFCAMFTGHILALPAFYCILNGLVTGIGSLVSGLLSESLYGFNGFNATTLERILTPVWALGEAAYGNWSEETGRYYLSSSLTVGMYALAGLLLAALALLLYRQRQMETAGDVVSVGWVRPIFLYGVALCAGLAGGMAFCALVGLYGRVGLWVSIFLWTVVGYFAAKMLLKKSFRVFRDGWKGLILALCAVAVGCGVVELDLLGYETRVPAADQVDYVEIDGINSAPYDNGSGLHLTVDDVDQVAEVIALHQALVEQHGDDDTLTIGDDDSYAWGFVTVRLNYTMKNGSTLRRSYMVNFRADKVNEAGTVAWAAQRLLDDPAIVEEAYDLPALKDGYYAEQARLTLATGVYGEVTVARGSDAQAIWQAVLQDFDEGNLGKRYLDDDSTERMEHCYFNDLIFRLTKEYTEADGKIENASRDFTVTITPEATHTLAALKQVGALDQVELVLYGEKLARADAENVVDQEWMEYDIGPDGELIPRTEQVG